MNTIDAKNLNLFKGYSLAELQEGIPRGGCRKVVLGEKEIAICRDPAGKYSYYELHAISRAEEG